MKTYPEIKSLASEMYAGITVDWMIKHTCYAIIHENQLFGYLYLEMHDDYLEIGNYVISPKLRGKGYGTRIFEEIMSFVKQFNKSVYLRVATDNAPALKIYNRYKKRIVEYWYRLDKVNMSKRIPLPSEYSVDAYTRDKYHRLYQLLSRGHQIPEINDLEKAYLLYKTEKDAIVSASVIDLNKGWFWILYPTVRNNFDELIDVALHADAFSVKGLKYVGALMVGDDPNNKKLQQYGTITDVVMELNV